MKKTVRENIKKSISNVVDEALDEIDERYQELGEQASDFSSDLKGKAQDVYNSAKEKIDDVREKGKTYVAKNPEKSMLLAAGVGMLVAFAISNMALMTMMKKIKRV